MLQQIIRRHRRPSDGAGDGANDGAAARPAEAARVSTRSLRPADWLLGAAVATLAVAFVAGLLALRSSTTELQDQSRNNARDLTALKADTVERINSIAGELAKTNQTLTDIMAMRGGEAAGRVVTAKAAEAHTGSAGDGKAGEGQAEGSFGKAGAAAAAARAAAKPSAKTAPVRLGAITVPRRPERARESLARPPVPPTRPAAAARPEARGTAEAQRARREAVLRQLRLRRLARRGPGPQPL